MKKELKCPCGVRWEATIDENGNINQRTECPSCHRKDFVHNPDNGVELVMNSKGIKELRLVMLA